MSDEDEESLAEGNTGPDRLHTFDPDLAAGDEALVAVFLIPLEAPLAIENGSTFMLEGTEPMPALDGARFVPTDQLPGTVEEQLAAAPRLRGRSFVSLRIWQVEEAAEPRLSPLHAAIDVASAVFPSAACEALQDVPARFAQTMKFDQTVVEVVVPLLDEDVIPEERLARAYERGLEGLQELVDAYVLLTHDVRLLPVSKASVYGAIVAGVRTLRGPPGAWGPANVMLVNAGLSLARPPAFGPMAPTDYQKLAIIVSRRRRGDPLLVAAHRLSRARRAIALWLDTSTAVVESQVACEAFFDQLLLLMAWEEGLAPEHVARWFGEGLAKRLRTHFGGRLGTNWDTTNTATVIGRWYRDIYMLRNRVIHAAHFPSEEEALRSVEVAHDVVEFIKDRLIDRRTQYPRAALLVLGEPGLERRGALTRRIRDFIETTAPTEPDWIATYRAWLDRVEALLPQT